MQKQSTIQAMKIAGKGALMLLSERSIKWQLVAGALITITGICVGLTPFEWALQTLAIGLVLCTEGVNTAIEHLADFVEPKYDLAIGRLKDIAAGAVFLAAMTALLVAAFIYLPKLV